MLTLSLLILLHFARKEARNKVASHAAAFLYIWICISFFVESLPSLTPIPILAKFYIFICASIFVGGTFIGNIKLTPQRFTYNQDQHTKTNRARNRHNRILYLINGLLIVFVIWLFNFWYGIASNSPQELLIFINEARYDAVNRESIFSGLPIYIKSSAAHLFIFTIYLISSGRTKSWWAPTIWINIVLASTASMLEGGRSGLIFYFASFLAALHASRNLSLKDMTKYIILLVFTFIVLAVTMRPSESDGNAVARVLNHLAIYALSPTVLFGQWFDNPAFTFPWSGPAHFLSIIGFTAPLKSASSMIVPFWIAGEGFDGEVIEGNVYTAFCVIIGNIGLFTGFIYWFFYGWTCGAIETRKSPTYISLYAMTLPSVMLTIFSEYLISNVIITGKLLLLHFIIWISNRYMRTVTPTRETARCSPKVREYMRGRNP